MPARRVRTGSSGRWIGLAVAVAVIVALGGWVLAEGGGSGSDRATSQAPTTLLSTARTIGTPLATGSSTSVMVGRTSGVRLDRFGFTDRAAAGSGQLVSARSGQRLLAFSYSTMAGDLATAPPVLYLRVGSSLRGPLVSTSDFIVASVPAATRQIDLVLRDSGVDLAVSLLTGRPASTNPEVSSRMARRAALTVTEPITAKVSTRAGAATVTGTLRVTSVALSYWAANATTAAGRQLALLHVAATVQFPGDKMAYGAEAPLLSVLLADGSRAVATNRAANPTRAVDDVVQVPADLTTATLRYAGSLQTSQGQLTIVKPVDVAFDLPTA